MQIKTKLIAYISVVAILAGVAAVFGFLVYGKYTVESFSSFLPHTVAQPSETHRSYSMDKGFYDVFFADPQPKEKVTSKVFSAVVPHHLIAGQFIGSFFNSLQDQNPDVVVVIGPNHKQIGNDTIITSPLSWLTPYGTVSSNQKIVNKIVQAKLASISTEVMGDEHSVSTLAPFIKKTWPEAKIVPIILKNNTDYSRLDELTKLLASAKEKVLVLTSVDFSHYLPKSVADFHDELSLNVLESGSLGNLPELEVDSQPSLYALLKYNEYKNSQTFTEVSHTNSGQIIGKDLAETTSHIIGYYTAGSPAKKPAAALQFFGDIMLDRDVVKAMGVDGLDYVLANLHGQENRFFSGMHMLVANLEGPFASTRIQTSKTIAFQFDPKYATQLKSYGFDAFNLANNHSYDMGSKNVVFTREILGQNSLGYFGDEYNQGPEYTYIVGEEKNLPFKIAFIGFNTTEGPLDMAKVKEAVDDAKSKAKFVIVNIHWGEEYHRQSNQKQQDIAHQLVDWGVDVIIGHHPHVVEEVEVYKDKYIFYSLGNFIFDQYFSKDTQEGMSVGLVIQDDGTITPHLIPLFSRKSQVQVMVGKQKDEFFDWLKKNSRMGSYSFNF